MPRFCDGASCRSVQFHFFANFDGLTAREFYLVESGYSVRMPSNGETVKPSLRKILADSHVAAVAIAVLLFWSLDWTSRGLCGPLYRAADFLFTAVAILGIPYFSRTLTLADFLMLIRAFFYLIDALIAFAAAWLVSRWVYGAGPFRSLSAYWKKPARRNHA
jgi:hypothetical protein